MKTSIYFIGAATVLIAGCATQPSGEQFDKLDEISKTIPTCTLPKECEVKWNAARTWVLANSEMKLQHVSQDYLETFNSPRYSPGLAAIVVKEPRSDGSYRITLKVWCSNTFGCTPNTISARLDFNRRVNASWQPPTN